MSISKIWIAYYTIVAREILRFSRIWLQTIVPPMITTALYFIIFGNLIGSQIGNMDGYSYMEFIVPGLIMMSVINNAYANVVSSFYGSKFQGNIAEMLISPIPNWIILLGYVTGGVARGIVVGIAVTLVSLFFSELQITHFWITSTIVLLTAALFSIAGLINAVYAKSFDSITIIPTFVLTPLTYLGGVFYSISLLPPFWQHASLANPIFYMVNGFRYGILGTADINIWMSYGVIIGFIVLLGSFALYLLNYGVGIRS